MRDMVKDLNQMLEEKMSGQQAGLRLFMQKHGQFFPQGIAEHRRPDRPSPRAVGADAVADAEPEPGDARATPGTDGFASARRSAKAGPATSGGRPAAAAPG